MFSLMLFMFLFFLGSIAMFFYVLKKIDDNARQLAEEHAQIRVLVRAVESHLEKLRNCGSDTAFPKPAQEEDSSDPEYDPLLRLSFDQTTEPEKGFYPDPGLNLNLEADTVSTESLLPPVFEPEKKTDKE